MKFTLAQIAAAAGRGGMDGDEVMHDLLTLAEKNGNTPTLREYFIASAPEHPQPWFKPAMPHEPLEAPTLFSDMTSEEREDNEAYREDMIDVGAVRSNRLAAHLRQRESWNHWMRAYNADIEKQRMVQWPSAWADEQLKLLAARLIG